MLPQRDEWSSAATDMGDIVTEEDTRQAQRPAGVEIVPAFALREIDAAVAGLIFRDRARHQSRTQHPLVADVCHIAVGREVHRKAAEHGVVLKMHGSGQGIEVRHQTVTQLHVIEDA